MGINSEAAAVPPFRVLAVEGSLEDIEGGRVAMSLNAPRLSPGQRCEIDGPLEVRGWAHSRAGVECVAVFVDGRRFEALRPIVRTDLVDYYGRDAAAEAGFVLRLHASECPPGEHRVAVVAFGHDGDVVGVVGDVLCRPSPSAAAEPPPRVASVEWIDGDVRPGPPRSPAPDLDPPTAPEHVAGLHGLVAEWESRARLAEADAAASRIEAGLASVQQEAAVGRLRAVEARLREVEAELDRLRRG